MTRDISSSSATCPCTMPSMESTRMDSLMCFILMEVNHRGHLDILYETWALFGFYVKNLEFVSFAKEIFKPMGVCMRKKLISIWIEFKTLLEGKTYDKPILNSLVPHRISLTVWCGNLPPLPCTHLYSWVKRGAVHFKHLAQKHNRVNPLRVWTLTSKFTVSHAYTWHLHHW